MNGTDNGRLLVLALGIVADKHDVTIEDVDTAIRIYKEGKEVGKTTVTVWADVTTSINHFGHIINCINKGKFIKHVYTIPTPPDIDAIIADTLDKGALFVDVESDTEFVFAGDTTNHVCIWKKELGYIETYGWVPKGYKSYLASYMKSLFPLGAIETAITKYLNHKDPQPQFKVGDVVKSWNESKNWLAIILSIDNSIARLQDGGHHFMRELSELRLATPAEEADFYIVDISKTNEPVLVRAYRFHNNSNKGICFAFLSCHECYLTEHDGTALATRLGVPVKVLEENEQPTYPTAKGESDESLL